MKKTERAYQLALTIIKENPDITDSTLRTKLREQIPCSRTTSYKAQRRARRALEEYEEAKTPSIEAIKPEPSASPPEIEVISPAPIREIEEPEIEEIEKPAEVGEPEFIRDMLKNIHALFLSNEGLFEEYGVSVQEAERQGGASYMVLKDTVGEEALRKYGVYMLIAGYIGIVGKMGVKFWRKRKKEKAKQKPKIETNKQKTS